LYDHAIYGKHDGDGIQNADALQKIMDIPLGKDFMEKLVSEIYNGDEKAAQNELMAIYKEYTGNKGWKSARQNIQIFMNV